MINIQATFAGVIIIMGITMCTVNVLMERHTPFAIALRYIRNGIPWIAMLILCWMSRKYPRMWQQPAIAFIWFNIMCTLLTLIQSIEEIRRYVYTVDYSDVYATETTWTVMALFSNFILTLSNVIVMYESKDDLKGSIDNEHNNLT